jgi:hypothetical protein
VAPAARADTAALAARQPVPLLVLLVQARVQPVAEEAATALAVSRTVATAVVGTVALVGQRVAMELAAAAVAADQVAAAVAAAARARVAQVVVRAAVVRQAAAELAAAAS